jgi:hypothetical protein
MTHFPTPSVVRPYEIIIIVYFLSGNPMFVISSDAFKAVFRQFVLVCRKRDLFGAELLAVDGTRLKAANSTERNRS